MKRKTSMILLAALTAASMALTACGGSGAQTAEPAAETEEASATDTENEEGTQERPYYVHDSSEITGKLNVYTTMEETQQIVLQELWSKYYPDCELEIQADSIGTLATKIRSDESTDDESGYYTFYDVQLMCLVVNPDLRDELGIEIKGYEDLLQPELKGKIIIAAPDASSSGYRQLQTVLATMGDSFNDEKSWEYIGKLIPQTFSTTSSKDVFNLVSTGESVVGLSYESSVVALINDGAPIECVYMKEGNTAMAGGAAIIKTAPNLPAAQAMMDLLSSAEFQDARAQASAGRGSNSNCNLQGLPEESGLGIVDLDFDYLAAHKEELINRFTEMYADLSE